ncbi:MAG TPA: type VI secretion system tube protein Hcp [Burkholderiaceae bacterium]|nr:type VI secretion system tube protein Hcp [Burkholderiaceae bacterium]
MADIIHISLTGIKGESTFPRHKDEIALESWNWGVSTPQPSSSGGSAVGKPSFSPLTFGHRVDLASPLLWRACVTGQHIQEGILSVARPMATAGDYITLRLSDVVITSLAISDVSADTQPPLEMVTITFAVFEYTYRPQLANGTFGPPVTLKFDIHQNRVL